MCLKVHVGVIPCVQTKCVPLPQSPAATVQPSAAGEQRQSLVPTPLALRRRRCLTPGAAAPEDALCADAADGRPRVLISVVAFANESFGVIRDHGLMGKGARGLDGFLGMLAEQVRGGRARLRADCCVPLPHARCQQQGLQYTCGASGPRPSAYRAHVARASRSPHEPRPQDYPACRLSLGLLVSNEAFFKAASDSVNRFVRERGMARGVVTYKHLDTGIDPDKRHTCA